MSVLLAFSLVSLRTQILGGFAVLLVPLVVIAIVAGSVIGRLGSAVDTVLLENERTLAAAAEMDVALERLDSAALLLLLGQDAEAASIAEVARPQFRAALAVAEGNLTIDGEAALVGEVAAAFDGFERTFEEVAAAEGDAARGVYAESVVPAFEKVRARLGDVEAANRSAATAAAENAGNLAETALWTLVLGSLIALVLGVWAALKLSLQIARDPAADRAARP